MNSTREKIAKIFTVLAFIFLIGYPFLRYKSMSKNMVVAIGTVTREEGNEIYYRYSARGEKHDGYRLVYGKKIHGIEGERFVVIYDNTRPGHGIMLLDKPISDIRNMPKVTKEDIPLIP